MDRPIIVITGPTAVGKTDVAMALAERVAGEIVNADSMQVYIGMDIGTAKPTPDQRQRIPFHLIDIVPPDYPFSVAEWKERALAAIADITARGKQAILCGGTGMYLRALLEDWNLAGTPRDPKLREQLHHEAQQQGRASLHARLQEVDPETAARLHPNDLVRVVRALEVYYLTGKPLSEWQRVNKAEARPLQARQFILTMPRPLLYQRIEQRVEAMLAAGWEEEVRQLLAQGYSPNLTSMQSLGYHELVCYITGKITREQAVELIKQNTRRFAKRQLTWFRAVPCAEWLSIENKEHAEVAEAIIQRLVTQDTTCAVC
ncbi:tRNA isopentenyltransferase MiaA [Chthonomonas calidirosea]|uniref:tRNA dimethylallyltransferase n=1 Tax=Chthonomonas calidirosea (strain DSM 23976 / ICMP 18418 / T49) TaxID=1303518 RepID=S0EVB3_CHTCT|nr:tRNA (adenosine(37)-N6)-dimethylallyltransferase MiaA [Chthonomonas calidirosea]CCW34292.1 tRNA dimethylallyltransferase [Chthonomonas calidirosea T49]CEK15197.1 tRNA isopentenyltransferase MiaA [Chthonomonas calidirosea]